MIVGYHIDGCLMQNAAVGEFIASAGVMQYGINTEASGDIYVSVHNGVM